MKSHPLGEQPLTRAQYGEEIDQVNDRLSETTRLNGNLERSIDAPEVFRSTIRKGIEDEQIAVMEELFDAAVSIPYEEISVEHLRRARALAEAEVEATQAESQLEQGLQLAKELTTMRHEEMDKIYQATTVEMRAKANKLAELRSQMDEIEELFDATSPAWPIPQGMSSEDIKALYDVMSEDAADDEQIDDIIPVTPEDRQRTNCLAEKAKRVVENNHLSDNIMFYLRENQGNVVTVEEMIRFCYAAGVDGDLDGDHGYRSRITSALGPHSNGLKKQQELNDEGLVLQYGWRYVRYRTDGGHWAVRRRTRIYRVLDEHGDTSEEARGFVGDDIVTDKWRTTEGQKIAPKSDAAPDDIEELEVINLSDIVEVSDSTSDQEPLSWEQALTAKTEEAIDRAITVGLFTTDLDFMRESFIRGVSESNIIGTKTARQRLVEAGLMKTGEAKNGGMTRTQVIFNSLINTTPELQGARGNRVHARAADIVEKVIDRRLQELKAVETINSRTA